jgi:hypothetical protein
VQIPGFGCAVVAKATWHEVPGIGVDYDPSCREPEVVCKFFYEGFFTAASGEPR